MAPLNRVKCQYCPQTFAKIGAALENHKVHKHWDALVRDYPEKYGNEDAGFKAAHAQVIAEAQASKQSTLIIDNLSGVQQATKPVSYTPQHSKTDHEAVRGIIGKLDKGLPDFMEPNGADRLREIARRLLLDGTVGGKVPYEAIAEELVTIAAALDFLYKEVKTLDLRRLQAKASRWDTVAKAVIESLNEEVRSV